MAVSHFISAMNNKAIELSMSNTNFVNSSGLYSAQQYSTPMDMLRMGVACFNTEIYEPIRQIWGLDCHEVNIGGVRARKIAISSTWTNLLADIVPDISSNYKILGGKSGLLFGKSNLFCIAQHIKSKSILATLIAGATSREESCAMTKRVLDLASKEVLLEESQIPCFYAFTKIGGYVRMVSKSLEKQSEIIQACVKDIEKQLFPASIIQLMTSMILIDSNHDLNEELVLQDADLMPGSGPVLYAGDKITFRDALHFILISSSNTAAQAVARVVGDILAGEISTQYNLWYNDVVDQKHEFSNSKEEIWTARSLATFLEGEWVVPPPEDFNASYFARSGYENLEPSYDMPVSMIVKKVPPAKHAKAIIGNLLEDEVIDSRPYLKIKGSTSDASLALAERGRAAMNGNVIAITGSVGKSTTTKMLSELLKVYGIVQRTVGDLNMTYGIRTVLASLVTEPDYAVIEIDEASLAVTNDRVAEIIKPNIAMITNLDFGHADAMAYWTKKSFIDKDDIGLIMSRICESVVEGGVCLINRNIECFDLVRTTVESYGAKPVSYGQESNADVWISNLCENNEKNGLSVSVNLYGKEFSFNVPSYGTGFATNALGILTAIHHLGLDAREASRYVEYLPRLSNRQEAKLVNLKKGGVARVVNDCFNAQFLSYLEILSVIKNWPLAQKSRRIGVFGNIKVFNDPRYTHKYASLVEPIYEAKFDKIFLVGDGVGKIASLFPPKLVGGVFSTPEDGLEAIANEIQADDMVFVKVTSGGIATQNTALKLINLIGVAQ